MTKLLPYDVDNKGGSEKGDAMPQFISNAKKSLLMINLILLHTVASCGGSSTSGGENPSPDTNISDVTNDTNKDGIYDIIQPEIVEGKTLPSGIYLSSRAIESRSESGGIIETTEETYNAEKTALTHAEYDSDGIKDNSYETETDDQGRAIKTSKDYGADGTVDHTESFSYDSSSNKIEYTRYDEEENIDDIMETYEYDDHNEMIRVASTTIDYQGKVTTSEETSTNSYDEDGNKIAAEIFVNGARDYSYTAEWKNGYPLSSYFSYYENDGALNRSESYTYTFNDKAQLVETILTKNDYAGEITGKATFTYLYDDTGNLIQKTEEQAFYDFGAIYKTIVTTIDYTLDSYGYHLAILQTEDGGIDKYTTYINTYSDGTKTDTIDGDSDGFFSTIDCDDNNVHAHSLDAEENCDGFDNNCNGEIDETDGSYSSGKDSLYADGDRDGYGTGNSVYACSGTSGYVDNNDDCDDTNPDIGDVSEELLYYDGDGDGHGQKSDYVCVGTLNYVSSNDDCNDADAEIYPGHKDFKIPGDTKDNDCDEILNDDVIKLPSGGPIETFF